jgi:cyclic beta-1,2-glucan synthetase
MYRVGIEGILGLTMVRAALHVDPCIPKEWPEFSISFRRPRCDYHITIENPDRVSHGVVRVELDGEEMKDGLIPIREDGRSHVARVVLGSRASS